MNNQPIDLIERQRQLDEQLQQGGQAWLDEQLENHGITFDKPYPRQAPAQRRLNGLGLIHWLMKNKPDLIKRGR